MKRFLTAAVLCLLTFATIPAFPDDDPSGADPRSRVIPELTLKERVEDLLEAVEDESPEVFRRIDELPREEALARIMRALDSGVVPASAAKGKPVDVPFRENDFRQYPVFGITDRMFPYLRFDALSQERVSASLRELGQLNGGKAPAGVIVDLRETAAGTGDSVKPLSDALGKLGCPVMALISGRTARQGELLAAVLRRDCGAVLIGTETAGEIFPIKRITVNDVRWFVPDPPAEYYDISPYALKPDLEKDSEVRMSFDELKEKPNKLDGDPLLRLAADLLTMKAAVKPVAE